MTGPQIRRERRRLKLTQTALGAIVGVHGTQVARWEAGKKLPNEANEVRLRAVFDGAPVEPPLAARVRTLETLVLQLAERVLELERASDREESYRQEQIEQA